MTARSASSRAEEDQLADELKRALQRRLEEVFKVPAKRDQAKFGVLALTVQQLAPETWHVDPTRALSVAVRFALEEFDEGYPENAEQTWQSRLSWSEIGEILCGLRNDLPSKADGTPLGYDDYRLVAINESEFAKSDSTFQRAVIRPFRLLLARKLLELAESGVTIDVSPRPQPTDSTASAQPLPEPPPPLTIHFHQQTSNQELDRAVAELAETVKHRLRTEQRLRRPSEPPYFIPLRWCNVREDYADCWENIRGIPGQNEPLILDDTLSNIADTYAKVPSGRLVILGYPGSGKTMLATELALALLKEDSLPYGRVPVIFRLSSWNPTAQSLRDWMIDFLLVTYPKLFASPNQRDIAKKLVYWNRILPILDGFDEIPRDNQAYALHVLNASFDHTDRFVLTSRAHEYQYTVEVNKPLSAAAVITLERPTHDDIIAYLPSPKWDPVIQGLSKGELDLDYYQAKRAMEVLSTPLMLSVARTVYGDSYPDPSELLDFSMFRSYEAVRNHLLDRYLIAIYEQPPQDRDSDTIKPYDCSGWQARYWLGCIAAYLCGMYSLDLPAWDMQRPMTILRELLSYSFLGRQGVAAKIMPTWTGRRYEVKPSPQLRRRWLRRYISRSAGYAFFVTWLALEIAWRVDNHYVGPSHLRTAAIVLPVIGGYYFTMEWFFIRSLVWKMSLYENPMLPARSSRLASFLMAAMELFFWESATLLAVWLVAGKFVFYPPVELWPLPLFVIMFIFDNSVQTYWTSRLPQLQLTLTGKLPRYKLDFLEDAYRRGILRKNGGMYQFRHRIFQEWLARQWISAQPQRVTKRDTMQNAVKALEQPHRYLRS